MIIKTKFFVISSLRDEPEDWIAAGQLLERLALEATAHGLAYGIIESPIEVSKYRPQLAGVVSNYGLRPQVLMRFGRCTRSHHPTPRRPLNHTIANY